MVLLRDPSLAEVPDLPRHVLTAVARSVEERRQQLERDIEDYIRRKQEALRCHEQEVPALLSRPSPGPALPVYHHPAIDYTAAYSTAVEYDTAIYYTTVYNTIVYCLPYPTLRHRRPLCAVQRADLGPAHSTLPLHGLDRLCRTLALALALVLARFHSAAAKDEAPQAHARPQA